MGLIAAVLILIILFFWFAFCFTLWAWLQAIVNLCQCKFIRSSIWFVIGTWMLFWWFDKLDEVNFWPGACFFVGVGVLATLARYLRRNTQADRATAPATVER